MLNRTNNLAVIFDMDGVVVDNTPYHILAWQKFAAKFGKKFSAKTIREKFVGRKSAEIIRKHLHKNWSQKELDTFSRELGDYYRKIYAKHIRPVKGLPKFLKLLKQQGMPVALATSSTATNVNWTLKHTKLRKYFNIIVDASGIKHGKPAPDIFLKAAKKLKVSPRKCVVFEDALMGILAAKRAGMKVVGVATSHKPSEIGHTDLVIKDFTKISIEKLAKLIGDKK